MTREAVCPEKLLENKHIKHATEDYLKENPWAFEHIPGETIHSI